MFVVRTVQRIYMGFHPTKFQRNVSLNFIWINFAECTESVQLPSYALLRVGDEVRRTHFRKEIQEEKWKKKSICTRSIHSYQMCYTVHTSLYGIVSADECIVIIGKYLQCIRTMYVHCAMCNKNSHSNNDWRLVCRDSWSVRTNERTNERIMWNK